MWNSGAYAICVIGGAAAGAEAAGIFARSGILTVVFEQNARPYGKVEDGLPRWHVALRQKEYAAIDSKLTLEGVQFVPNTEIGRELRLPELTADWGFHAVVLANGAWRDRPLPVEGADAYVGRGFAYQNPFVYWFNHYKESGYEGPQFEILDGTAVVGGGLASIDVAKVINLELSLRALAERGIEQDLVELEVSGIPKTLSRHGLSWEDLGLEGATLFYRRRPEDMPLVELPAGADQKQRERIARSRARLLEKATSKYLFRVEPLRAPVGLIVERDRLAGLSFAVTRVDEGRVSLTDKTVEVHAPMFISSIGSIPSPLAGIDMRGEFYAFDDQKLGRIEAFPTLFSVGNVVTGKGNIVASRRHAKDVATHVTEEYLQIADAVKRLEPLSPAKTAALLERVSARQRQVGYSGDYRAWIQTATPSDCA